MEKFYEEQAQYNGIEISEILSGQSYRLEEAGNAMIYRLYIPPLLNKEAIDSMINKLRGLNIISFRVGMSYNRKDALEELEKKGITNVLIEDLNVTPKRIVIKNPTQILKEQMQELAG